MYSIIKETVSEIEVERSRFIGIITHIENIEEIKDIITSIKKKYPKARHYCYAATIDGNKKYSDDGEPQGTAGKPMLDVLEKKNLTNVLIVVVRYFGGILLGSGRLLRTYVETTIKTISASEIVKIAEGYEIEFSVDYPNYDIIRNFLKTKGIQIDKVDFLENVLVTTFSLEDYSEEIASKFYGKVLIKKVLKKVAYTKEGI